MKNIQQAARFAVAVYQEYRDRGLSQDEAIEKAASELSECCTDAVLNMNDSNCKKAEVILK